MTPRHHLFAYGSLAAAVDEEVGELVELVGHIRTWSVAMDNRRTLPGYKHYTLDGGRPALHVAFLTVTDHPEGSVNGLAIPATPETLAALDDRERNYVRVDVSEHIRPGLPGPVHTYVASAAGRARYQLAHEQGDGAVHAAYLEAVEAGFAALGEEQLNRFRASTLPPPFPVLPMERHENPPG